MNKSKLYCLILIIGSIFVALLTGELILRLSGHSPAYHYPQGLFTADSDLGYRLNPLFKTIHNLSEFRVNITINQDGYRDDSGQNIWSEEELTILGLGDSFTFGVGIEQGNTYLDRLEQLIKKNGISCNVINAGVPGYGTRQELFFYKKYGSQFPADIVLLGFVMANDPEDSTYNCTVKKGYLINQGSAQEDMPLLSLYSIKSAMRKKSVLYSFIIDRLRSNAYLNDIFIKLGLTTGALPGELQFYEKAYNKRVYEKYLSTRQELKELREASLRQGAKLLVIGIPLKIQVSSELWNRAKNQYRLKDADFDRELPNKTVSGICQDEGILFFDLLPVFKGLSREGQRLYYNADSHWNQNAHNYAADLIYSFIEDQGYLLKNEDSRS